MKQKGERHKWRIKLIGMSLSQPWEGGPLALRTEIALFTTMVKHESVEKSSLHSDLSYLMAV